MSFVLFVLLCASDGAWDCLARRMDVSGSLLMYMLRSVYGIEGKKFASKIYAHTLYLDCIVVV